MTDQNFEVFWLSFTLSSKKGSSAFGQIPYVTNVSFTWYSLSCFLLQTSPPKREQSPKKVVVGTQVSPNRSVATAETAVSPRGSESKGVRINSVTKGGANVSNTKETLGRGTNFHVLFHVMALVI